MPIFSLKKYFWKIENFEKNQHFQDFRNFDFRHFARFSENFPKISKNIFWRKKIGMKNNFFEFLSRGTRVKHPLRVYTFASLIYRLPPSSSPKILISGYGHIYLRREKNFNCKRGCVSDKRSETSQKQCFLSIMGHQKIFFRLRRALVVHTINCD